MEEQNLDQVIENVSNESHVEHAPTDSASQPTPPAQAWSTEHNLRKLREKAERSDQMERERDQYYRMLKDQEQQRASPVSQDDGPAINDDDLVEWKHVKKAIQNIEKKFEVYTKQTTATTAEARIKAQYNDFDKVVTPDTIANLRESYPEIAATINSNSDVYTQAVAAYTFIKKLNTVTDDQYESDKNRIQANAAKPRPVSSVSPQSGESPLSRANAFAEGLTPDLKKQLYKEMQETKKNR